MKQKIDFNNNKRLLGGMPEDLGCKYVRFNKYALIVT